MAKQTGLGDNFYLDGYDISGDVGSIQTIRVSRALLDVTGIDKDAHERLPGLGDSEMSFNNWFNPTDDTPGPAGAHFILKDILNARHALYFRGTLLGGEIAAMIASQATYQLNRGNDGSLAGTVQLMNASGKLIEWGHSLTPGKQNVVAAGNLSSVLDLDSPQGSAGLSAYWQLFALAGIAGNDINIKLQHSDYATAIGVDDDAVLLVTNLLSNHTYAADGVGFTGTVEPRRITVTIVDTTPSIVAGTVTLNGLDSNGDALVEIISIAAGAGTYTSTKFFSSVSTVVTSITTVLGGAGDETIKVGVQAAVVAFADIAGGAFVSVDIAAVPAKQHIDIAATIKRVLRGVVTTVDGFTSADIALAVKRKY